MATMVLDDPAGYGRVVRRRTAASSASSRRRRRATRRPSELAIREVNTGVFAFDGARADATRCDALAPDNAQGELYLPDVLPICATQASRRAHGSTTRPRCSASTTASSSHGPRARAAAHPRAPHARGRDDRRPRQHADRRRRHDRPGHGRSSRRRSCAAPRRIGERCTVGPLTTLIDAALGDEVRVLHSYLVECEVRDGAIVGPFAYLRPGTLLREGSKAGTFVEIKNSDIGAGHQGPAPLLHRRRRHRRGHEHRRRQRSPPTTTAPRKHRTTIGARVKTSRRHDVRRAGHGRRRRVHRRRLGDHRRRAARRARHRPRPPDQHRGLRGAQAGARVREQGRRIVERGPRSVGHAVMTPA